MKKVNKYHAKVDSCRVQDIKDRPSKSFGCSSDIKRDFHFSLGSTIHTILPLLMILDISFFFISISLDWRALKKNAPQ